MEFRQDVKSVFISVIGCHMTKISLKKQTDHDKKVCPKLKVPDPEVIIVSVMIPARSRAAMVTRGQSVWRSVYCVVTSYWKGFV